MDRMSDIYLDAPRKYTYLFRLPLYEFFETSPILSVFSWRVEPRYVGVFGAGICDNAGFVGNVMRVTAGCQDYNLNGHPLSVGSVIFYFISLPPPSTALQSALN